MNRLILVMSRQQSGSHSNQDVLLVIVLRSEINDTTYLACQVLWGETLVEQLMSVTFVQPFFYAF